MAAKYPTMEWDCAAEDLPEEFGLFKQRMELVCEDNGVTDSAQIARKIKIGLGNKGLRRLNASGLRETDLKVPSKIWAFFEAQLQVTVNFRIQRLLLMQMRQRSDEGLDDFITRARTQAQRCEFTDAELQERIIELIIAGTHMELYRRDLLAKGKELTLNAAIQIGRQHEAAAKGSQHIEDLSRETAELHSIRRKKATQNQPKGEEEECERCGRQHPPRRCPAFRSECRNCGKQGHWMKMCPAERGGKSETRCKIDDVAMSETDEEQTCMQFYSVTNSTRSTTAFTGLKVKVPMLDGQHGMRVKMDSGANANALPLRTFRQMYGKTDPATILKPLKRGKLTSYSGDELKCYGSITLMCQHGESRWIPITFYVVDVRGPVIMGLHSCQRLKLLSIHCDCT